jgi:pyruvate kinase
MLSGETAYGANPIDVVEIMSRILSYNETVIPESNFEYKEFDNTKYIVSSAASIAKAHNINKIIALTETGYTARALSALRPRADIVAVTDVDATLPLLNMSGGVMGFRTKYSISDLSSYDKIIEELKDANILDKGETVIAIHGQTFGLPGGTNSMMILEI